MRLELEQLLENLRDRTKGKFARMPSVITKNDSFNVQNLPVDKPEWHAIDDVVCLYFDLKSSTKLAKRRNPRSTASIYDAGVGGVAKVLREFDAQFLDIQGDGGFGLFWGERRFERAVTAGISVRTFSSGFTAQLEAKWPEAPSTGFKVGIASGSLMAKRVGLPRHLDFQEPVWAGNPVNYAAKAAQQASPGKIVVTGSVYDSISANDYLVFSCGCGNTDVPRLLWGPEILVNIPDEEKYGQALENSWCEIHGEDYCNAILEGQTRREEVSSAERSLKNSSLQGSSELHEAFNPDPPMNKSVLVAG